MSLKTEILEFVDYLGTFFARAIQGNRNDIGTGEFIGAEREPATSQLK
jgi:hypothetical protein